MNDRFRKSNSRLPDGLVMGSDYSINPMPGQLSFDLRQRIRVGTEIEWDQAMRHGRSRRMRGPVTDVAPSGWLTVRSRQCNMAFAVNPADQQFSVSVLT